MTDKAILGADLISGLISTLGKQVVSLKLQLASLQAHLSSSSGLEKSVKALLPERGHLDLGQVPGLIMRLSKERSLGAALSGDDGQILMASPAFYSLTGLKLDDPGHSTVRFYLEEAGLEKECENLPWILALPNLRGGGETVLFSSRYLVRQPGEEGAERWLQFVFRPLTGDGGGCLIFVAEATEEVAGERQLAEQVALLRAHVDSFNAPVEEFGRVLERVLAFNDFGQTRPVLESGFESEESDFETGDLDFELGEGDEPAFTEEVGEFPAPTEVFHEMESTSSSVDEVLPAAEPPAQPEAETEPEPEPEPEPPVQTLEVAVESDEAGPVEAIEEQPAPVFEDSDLLEDVDSEEQADALSVVLDVELQGDSGLWQEFSDFVKEPSPVASPGDSTVGEPFADEDAAPADIQVQAEPADQSFEALEESFSPPQMEEPLPPEAEPEPEPESEAESEAEAEPEFERQSQIAPAVVPEPPVSIEKRALVVDDIPVNQKLLVHQLRKLGFKTDIANNGVEALDLFKKGYTIIFMDCDMPVMSGYEATAEIRRREVSLGSHVPIIAMTSYDRDTDKEKCLAAGMDDYLTKGVNEGTLSRVIETALSGAHSGHEGSADQVVQAQISETMTGGETAPFDADNIASSYSREELKDIMRSFLTAMESFVASMQKAIDDHDVEKVRQLSNSIKGPCASLGLKLMTRVASDIINYAQSADWPQVRLKYLKLKTVYLRSQNDLRKACPEVFEEAHHLIG